MSLQTIHLLAALSVCVAALILCRTIARGILRLVFARVRKRDAARFKTIKATLVRPVAAMVFTGVARVAATYMGIPLRQYAVTANVLTSAFLAAAFWALYESASICAQALLRPNGAAKRGADATAVHFIASGVRILVVVLGVLTVLSRWVSNISGLVAGLGIGGLALALAAQDAASNIFGSLSLMLDRSFEVGDWIEAGDIAGTVENVGFRSSRIRTADQSLVYLPNSKLSAQGITNCTKRNKRRVSMTISLPAETDADAVSRFTDQVKGLLEADREVLKDGIAVGFDRITPVFLVIAIGFFTTATSETDLLAVRERVNYGILSAMREV